VKNAKRILAIAGIIILAGLYIVTLILAIADNKYTQRWFIACIFATVVLPVLIYIYQWLYKTVKKKTGEDIEIVSSVADEEHTSEK
jgi:cytochrome bd-type quinol oxidase subunit 1